MKKQIYRAVNFFILFYSLTICPAFSQDTLNIDITKLENLFLEKNLFLLASKVNINKQEALIIQAKAYPNPTFYANFNVYDPENKILFHNDVTGQKDFQFEQLILLGGKRKTSIEIAKTNKLIAEAELSDLLRNLKFQLNKSFFSLYQYQNNFEKLNKQLSLLDTLINSYEIQASKGNISLKDVIRLKSIYLRINNEKAENLKLIQEENKILQLLTQQETIIVPIIKTETLDEYAKIIPLVDIENNALLNRPDLLIETKETTLAELNYRLQKKNQIPDPYFNMSTDQRGGAFRNQINAGIAMPLPLWNQNKGNIKAAKSEIEINQYHLEYKKREIKSEVFEAYKNMQRSITEYNKSKQLYSNNFDFVFKSVNENFSKNNISIIEFVDFLEAYNDALQEIERIKSQIAIGAASINYVSATKLY